MARGSRKSLWQEPAAPAAPEPSEPEGHPPAASPSVETVVLTVDAVAAGGRPCKAGSVIAPNVEGWPDHRVAAHLRDGRAKRV